MVQCTTVRFHCMGVENKWWAKQVKINLHVLYTNIKFIHTLETICSCYSPIILHVYDDTEPPKIVQSGWKKKLGNKTCVKYFSF